MYNPKACDWISNGSWASAVELFTSLHLYLSRIAYQPSLALLPSTPSLSALPSRQTILPGYGASPFMKTCFGGSIPPSISYRLGATVYAAALTVLTAQTEIGDASTLTQQLIRWLVLINDGYADMENWMQLFLTIWSLWVLVLEKVLVPEKIHSPQYDNCENFGQRICCRMEKSLT